MVIPSVGTIVLVRFPFSDLSRSKLRPAVVLADTGRNDWVLCQVTSQSYTDPKAVENHERRLNKRLTEENQLRPCRKTFHGKLSDYDERNRRIET